MAWNANCGVKYTKVKDNSLQSSKNYFEAHKLIDKIGNILDLSKFRDAAKWIKDKANEKGYFPDLLIYDIQNGKKVAYNIPAFKKLDGINAQIDKIIKKNGEQGLLFSKNNNVINPQVSDNKVLLIKEAIKNALPVEISNTVTVLKNVPLNIAGRQDLFLSLKEILNENGITDEMLINWAGANRAKTGNIKVFKTAEQLTKVIETNLNNLKKETNYPELKINPLALESFNKWKKALEKYPVAFQEMMLTHAIKYLRKPDRKSKYVLQLSEIALTNTYGIVVNKPHELNRVGKLYDQEVLATVSDATEHEPSASGKGYWVHIPRIQKGNGIKHHTRINDLSNDKNAPGKFSVEFMSEIDQDYDIEFFETKEQAEEFVLKLTGDTKDNSAQFKANVELLRKLSPSTWCTASSMTEHYVQNYDNYLLIVNGITVAGIEALPEEKQNDALVTEYKAQKQNYINGQIEADLPINEYTIAKLDEKINKAQNKTRKVKEVTSRANNGIASIDHLDDIKAFFIKHNLDLNNSTIQAAENKKALNKKDSDYTKEDYEINEYDYWIERAEEEGLYADYQADQEYQAQEYEYIRILNNITRVEDALNSEIAFNLDARYFGELPENIRNNKDVATKGVNIDPHNLTYLNENLPFYLDLAKIAIKNEHGIFNYLPEELKTNTELQTLYANGIRETQERIEAERLRIANLTPEQRAAETDDLPFSKTNANQIQGYYDANNDKVVVVASNTSVEEAPKIAIHEVAHRGMLRMAKDLGGVKELSKTLFAAEKQLMEKLPELLKRTGHTSLSNLMLDYGFTTNSEDGKIKLLSELAARWAETLVDKPKPSWWENLIQNISNWIKKFTGKTLSEQEVNKLVGGFVRYGTKKEIFDNKSTYLEDLYEKSLSLTNEQIAERIKQCE
jgi:hypothetical protein